MTRSKRITLAALIGAAALGAHAPRPARAQGETSAAPAPLRLQVSIAVPEEGALVGDPAGMGFIAGQALAAHGSFDSFDLVFLIDQSESTDQPAGADIDGDGRVGEPTCRRVLPQLRRLGSLLGTCLPNSDTVLSAELAAVRTLLGQLDPRTTQVGVVSFSGDGDPQTPDAWTSAPLTSDYAQVERALEAIAQTGSQGQTNMVAGLQRATLELVGAGSAYSTPRRNARKIALLLSDGVPTLPLEGVPDENRRLAAAAAAKARELGIRIDSYGIGAQALSEPVALVEIARATSGIFSAVLYPRDLGAVFEQVSFSELEELRIINRSTRREAEYVQRNADGTFSALVAMAEGENAIEVYARSSDGVQQTHTRRVRFLGDAPAAPLTPRLLAQRNRLMENRLADLRHKRLAVEALQVEDSSGELRNLLGAEPVAPDPSGRVRRVEVDPDRTQDAPAEAQAAPGGVEVDPGSADAAPAAEPGPPDSPKP